MPRGMRPSSDRPVNDPLSRTGHVQKPSIDGDPRRIIMGYPGYGKQPADNRYETRRQGERVPTLWHQEAGQWRPQAPPEFVGCSITLLKVWQYDPVTGGGLRLRAHPTHRQYAAVVGGDTIQVLDWESETVTDTQAVGSNVGDIAWHPSGLWLAASCFTSPRIKVYPFDPVTGLLGAAISDPATAAPSITLSTNCVRWHPSGFALFTTTATAATLVFGWVFSSGAFGAALPAIPNISSWGVVGNESHWLQQIGVWTPPAAFLSSIDGMAVNPIDGTVVASWVDEESVHFFSALPNGIDETFDPTDFGWGMRFDSDPQSSGPSTYSGKFPVISPDGTLVAFHANNSAPQPGGGNDVVGEATVAQLGPRTFGHTHTFPRHGKLRRKWTSGPYGNRDLLAWRPGRQTQQLMVPVAPQTFADLPNPEPRLMLWRVDGDRFAAACTYETEIPDDFDWGGLGADSAGAWTLDGDTFLAIPNQYNAFGNDCLMVFTVTGDP